MDKIPFSVYDFFGYLAPGFLLILSVDLFTEQHWLLQDDIGIARGIFWTGAAYIIGHILAGPSAWLYDRKIVGKLLKDPSINLFREPPERLSIIFPGYFTPFSQSMQKKIRDKAKFEGIDNVGKDLFEYAFGRVKKNENTMTRLNIFLYLYGFSRNISFTCILIIAIIGIGSWMEGTTDKLPWAFAALVINRDVL